MIKRVLAIFLLCGSGSTALAQDGSEGAAMRSPAGAQRFLARVAEEGLLRLYVGKLINGHARYYVANVTWVADGDCATRVELHSGGSDDGGVTFVRRDAAWIAAYASREGLPPPPSRFEWRTMAGLARSLVACAGCGPNSESTSIRIPSADPEMYFWFNDAATASRAEFAMKFLIERCGLPEIEGF